METHILSLLEKGNNEDVIKEIKQVKDIPIIVHQYRLGLMNIIDNNQIEAYINLNEESLQIIDDCKKAINFINIITQI